MRHRGRGGLDVMHPEPQPTQHVGYQRPVAPPPERLSAHHRGVLAVDQDQQRVQPFRECLSLHVIGIAAEGGAPPGRVAGVGQRCSPAAQLRNPEIIDVARAQSCGQCGTGKVRPSPGARVAPHIGDHLDPVSLQEGEKFIDGAGRMPDGPHIGPIGRRYCTCPRSHSATATTPRATTKARLTSIGTNSR
jgi:hypothetical protein